MNDLRVVISVDDEIKHVINTTKEHSVAEAVFIEMIKHDLYPELTLEVLSVVAKFDYTIPLFIDNLKQMFDSEHIRFTVHNIVTDDCDDEYISQLDIDIRP